MRCVSVQCYKYRVKGGLSHGIRIRPTQDFQLSICQAKSPQPIRVIILRIILHISRKEKASIQRTTVPLATVAQYRMEARVYLKICSRQQSFIRILHAHENFQYSILLMSFSLLAPCPSFCLEMLKNGMCYSFIFSQLISLPKSFLHVYIRLSLKTHDS